MTMSQNPHPAIDLQSHDVNLKPRNLTEATRPHPVSASQTTTDWIAVIGGGFTGAATAWNLVSTDPSIHVLVFEPRTKLGAGLAYDTQDPIHRINVPASRMSLDPDRPQDFADWLHDRFYAEQDPDAMLPDGSLFPRRAAFGDYVAARLEPYLSAGRIVHVKARVSSLHRTEDHWTIESDGGNHFQASEVVIATSHPTPSPPRLLHSMLEGHPRFVPDATVAGALDVIRPTDAALLVGNGLTSADVIASLLARGHTGPITSISRRGLRSRGHSPVQQDLHGDFVSRPIRSARLLARRVREAIDQAALFGVSWHAVLDAARAQGSEIWSNLSVEERRRLVRHLRPFWDVHRFRIAPQIERALAVATERGQLVTLAASVAAVTYQGAKIRIALKRARAGGTLIRDFDAVVVTTGPAHDAIIASQPYLAALEAEGLVAQDPLRLGLWCDANAHILDRSGHPVEGLYVAGPLARGTFGELMGLPQVSDHAHAVAIEILAARSLKTASRRQSADS
ncbi:FAD/NAD(P)-binding protein [Rhizobium alvei]|uniref:FAD/NAD(P)-binding protein n=1 Tax=Rhizobium alvei TaxID=1132659 RepID=A0ABT8YRI4_9HYPH|nr:FAD/NAD(P)-binding protein [Rhizobium alvei]MDO6966327.1 FAD/NAD(P)-binding protein [Rhizobium alvei]